MITSKLPYNWKDKVWWKRAAVTSEKGCRRFPWCTLSYAGAREEDQECDEDGYESDASVRAAAAPDTVAAPVMNDEEDYVTVLERLVVFHHVKPRTKVFSPPAEWNGLLRPTRVTYGVYRNTGTIFSVKENVEHMFENIDFHI